MTTTTLKKNIRINVNSTDKLNAAIEAAEGKARVRCIDADTVAKAVAHIESRLAGMLYKLDWTGLIFSCDPHAQIFPGAYNGTPESTQFMLERGPRGWFVTSVGRYACRGPQRRIVCRNIADKAEKLARFASENW